MRFSPYLLASIFIYSASALAAPAAAPPAGKKYTVCSATLNSSEEIDTFRKVLGDKKFNYVELTTLADIEETDAVAASREANPLPGPDWLGRSCEQKVQCDILVVSGHFGGKFFGKSGLELGMEDLEAAACDRRCDSVLKRPKEVFLFGCNTLAGKGEDFRTPEQYRQVLIDDGFDPETAEQIVAFRYSEIGESFSSRMSGVFQGAPRIYGFSSIAPAGKNVQNMLNNYLKEVEKDGYYKDGKFAQAGNSTNTAFMKALKVTHVAQSEGISPKEDYTSAVCFLNDPKKGQFEKLKWIEKALAGDRMLAHLPYATNYLNKLKAEEQFEWDDKNFEPFENVARYANAKKILRDLVLRPIDSMMSVQAKAIEFQNFMGWLRPGEVQELTAKLLLGNEKTKWTREHIDLVRSNIPSEFRLDVPYAALPANQFTNSDFLDTMALLKPVNADLIHKLIEMHKDESLPTDIRSALIQSIGSSADVNTEAQDYALKLFQSDNKDKVFSAAINFDFTALKMKEGYAAQIKKRLETNGADEFFWLLLSRATALKVSFDAAFLEKLKGLRETLFNAELDPNTKRDSLKKSPSCKFIQVANGILAENGEKEIYRLKDWPSLVKHCDAEGRNALTSRLAKEKEIPAPFLDRYLAALTDSYFSADSLQSIFALKAKMDGDENYPLFNAAIAKKFLADQAASSLPPTAAKGIMNTSNFPFLTFSENLMRNAESQKIIAGSLLTEKSSFSQMVPILLAPDLSEDLRAKLFEFYWPQQKVEFNTFDVGMATVALTPSLVPKHLSEIFAAKPTAGRALALSQRTNPDLVGAQKAINSEKFIAAFLTQVKKMDKTSEEYKSAINLVQSIRPNTEKAKQIYRELANDSSDTDLAQWAKSVLTATGDVSLTAKIRSSIENSECGPTKEEYFSNLSRFLRDILVPSAKIQIDAGINIQEAFVYLLNGDSGLSETEKTAFAKEFLSKVEKMSAEERKDLFYPVYLAVTALEQETSERPALYSRVRALLTLKGNPDVNQLRVIGYLAYRLPNDKELSRYVATAVAKGSVEEVNALTFTGANNGVPVASPEPIARALIERLKTDTSPDFAATIADLFNGKRASLKQKRELEAIFAKHPSEEARKSWNERNDVY